MTTSQKVAASFLGLCAVLGAFAFFGYTPFLSVTNKIEQLAGAASPTGTSFNSAKFAATTISLATPGANGTSTSILNTDAYDRFVTSFKVGCANVGSSKTAYTGTGLAQLLLSVGTTTTSAPASFSSVAAITLNQPLSTTTPGMLIASSTLQTATSTMAGIWPTNTYMTFYFNATNTAQCTVGVEYFGS